MPDNDNGNGRVTLAVLGEKVDALGARFGRLEERIEPYVLQCQQHEERSKAHIAELYDSDGHSRIYAMQLQLRQIEESTRMYMKQAEESIKTTITRRWAVIMVCIASVVGLAVQFLGRMIWPG